MFQYKLRTLLLAMLLIALATWVLFVLPDPAGVLVLSMILTTIPGIVAAGIVYSRGYSRAFFIGAAPMQVLVGMHMLGALWPYPYSQFYSFPMPGIFSSDSDTLFHIKVLMLGTIGVTLASSMGAMLIRYLAAPTVHFKEADPSAIANR